MNDREMWDRVENICLKSPMLIERPAPAIAKAFPKPLVGATVKGPEDWPDPVADLAALARRSAWLYQVTYAKGWTPHASYGTPSAKPKESWALRMRRGQERAVAVRMDGSWSSFWYWSPDTLMSRSKLLEDFRQVLSTGYPQAGQPQDQGQRLG